MIKYVARARARLDAIRARLGELLPRGADRARGHMTNLGYQTVYLLSSGGIVVAIPPDPTRVVRVETSCEPSQDTPIPGVPVEVESPPTAVTGFPCPDESGDFIVPAPAALAARQLALRTQARIYSPGPLHPRPDGRGMCADVLRRWPDWPSAYPTDPAATWRCRDCGARTRGPAVPPACRECGGADFD
jgi:hypothetical protein